ncbi:hypothetical protein NVP1123O_29 [Vibrio phage 1.123.O._10N.286.48.F3]|nr:hypothetical protein NVP1123O_29 [Vibrio phage 1.123.O._10N.286.48.F3]
MSDKPLVIPVEAYPEQPFSMNLDGNVYTIRVYWTAYDEQIKAIVDDGNDGKWFMDIAGGAVNVKGIALVGGCDLLEPYAYSELGSLLVLDTSGNAEDPNFAGMGARFELRYLPKSINVRILKEIGYL